MKKAFLVFIALLLLATLPLIHVEAAGASQGDGNVNVQVVSYFDPGNIITNVVVAAYGSNIAFNGSLITTGFETYSFVFWVVDGVVNRNLPLATTFLVTNDMDIRAIYKPADSYAVVFMDSNGKVLKVQYVANSGTADANEDEMSFPSKPGYAVLSGTARWDGSMVDITTDTVLTLQYQRTASSELAVVINGGTGDGTYLLNDLVTAVADAPAGGQYFQYWIDGNGSIVSRESTHLFTAVQSTTLTAVYAPYVAGTDYPYVTLSSDLNLRVDYTSLLGQYHLPDGYTFVETGILVSPSQGILDIGNVVASNRLEAGKTNGTTNEFLMSIRDSLGFVNYRAYLVCKDNLGALVTTYSYGVELFISEYSEGSSGYEKWIEIYNPTANSVDLSAYTLALYGNGSSTATATFVLSGTLASGDVYVVSNNLASAPVLAVADQTSSNLNHNGDDAYGLLKNEVLIDQFGKIGQDPGASWIPSTGFDTMDKTWTRNNSIDKPSREWNYQEWTVIANNTSYLGSHYTDDATSVTITGDSTVMAENTIQLMASVLPATAADTVTWSSNAESIATVSASGLVTAVSAGEVTITATSTVNGSILDTHVITVSARPSYTISASSNNESWGTVTPTSSSVLLGHDCVLTITPQAGYNVSSITVDGSPVEVNQSSYTISNVTAEHTVVVTFASAASYTISASSANEVYGTVSASPTSVSSGGSSTLTLTGASGYKAYSLTINGGSPVYVIGQTSYSLTNITDNMTVVVTFKAEVQSGTTIGFESVAAGEGFVATTTYDNTSEVFQGATGKQWGFYYGTSSTTVPLIGLQSAQMRWYTTAPTALGYTFTNFTTTDVSKVVFTANYTTGPLDVKVSYSTNGGLSWTDVQVVTLTTTATQYTVNINARGSVMIRFTVVTRATLPTATSRLKIDGVMIYKLE